MFFFYNYPLHLIPPVPINKGHTMAPLAPSATMQNPKAAHYTANLAGVLVRGAWTVDSPGAAPNGSPLSWSELVRKWGKHTGGSE